MAARFTTTNAWHDIRDYYKDDRTGVQKGSSSEIVASEYADFDKLDDVAAANLAQAAYQQSRNHRLL